MVELAGNAEAVFVVAVVLFCFDFLKQEQRCLWDLNHKIVAYMCVGLCVRARPVLTSGPAHCTVFIVHKGEEVMHSSCL